MIVFCEADDETEILGDERTLYNNSSNAICCGLPLWLFTSHVLTAGGSIMILRCAVIVAGVPKMPDMGAPARTRGSETGELASKSIE